MFRLGRKRLMSKLEQKASLITGRLFPLSRKTGKSPSLPQGRRLPSLRVSRDAEGRLFGGRNRIAWLLGVIPCADVPAKPSSTAVNIRRSQQVIPKDCD